MKITKTNLCGIIKPDTQEILMIFKKRGFGKDKFNLPGGKVDEHETFLEGCIRETQEETGLTPQSLIHIGNLDFFLLRENEHVQNQVFYTEKFTGEVIPEVDECSVHWKKIKDLPYNQMWTSDKIWYPEFLKKKPFHFEFTFKDVSDKNPTHKRKEFKNKKENL